MTRRPAPTAREGAPNFSRANRIQRVLWRIVWRLAMSWTPHNFGPWRRFLLRLFGARMADTSDVRGSAQVWLPAHLEMHERTIISSGVDCYNMAPIVIGAGAIVSQRAVLCAGTHDIDDPEFPLVTAGINLGPDSWIAAEAFVGPGVSVGEGAVLGARGAAFRDLEPWGVYVGNPAMWKRARKRSGA